MSQYPSKSVQLVDNGSSIEGVAQTATFQTDGLSLNDATMFSVTLSASAVSGTSPTCDVTIQYTPDGGTNWHSYPVTENSQTQATLGQITAAGNSAGEWWYNILPTAGSGAPWKIRAVFTIGGTNPSFTFDVARVAMVSRGQSR